MSADINTNPDDLAHLRTQLVQGASCQGGHSDEGRRIAGLLGIPFPLRMRNLAKRAVELELDPKELWPWYHGGDFSK